MSLIPIQNENRAFVLVQGAVAGFVAAPERNSLTWSVKVRIVELEGGTREASIVAPP